MKRKRFSIEQIVAGTLAALNPETRNKRYVACSRARGNLTFVPGALLKQHKRKRSA